MPPLQTAGAEKKPKPARKVRPALRPSGGSGIGGLNAGGQPVGSPTMLALLDDLNKELHGDDQGYRDGGASRPLVTPTLPEGTIAAGRLLDSRVMAVTAPSTLAQPGQHSLPSLRFQAEATDEGSAELGGSNEAEGEAGIDANPAAHPLEVTASRDAQATPLKGEPDFTFDPRSTAAKTTRKKGLQGAKRQTSPKSFGLGEGAHSIGVDDLLGKRSRRTSPIKPAPVPHFSAQGPIGSAPGTGAAILGGPSAPSPSSSPHAGDDAKDELLKMPPQ